jgi:hydrogenase maturation protease
MTSLVVGLGNPDRGDDAVGLLTVRRLEGRLPPGVDALEWPGDPTRLLDLEAWCAAECVVVVDATLSGATPGTVRRLDPAAVEPGSEVGFPSTHALGLAETLGLAALLDRLPQRVVIIGIEAGDLSFGGRPGPQVRAGVELAAALALEEVHCGGSQPSDRAASGLRGAR